MFSVEQLRQEQCFFGEIAADSLEAASPHAQVLARIAAEEDGTNSGYLLNPAVIEPGLQSPADSLSGSETVLGELSYHG